MSKQKLINGLKTAIYNLEEDTIKYDWNKPRHCNCGVVSRCILKYDNETFKNIVERPFTEYSNEGLNAKGHCGSWSDVSKTYCSITGISNFRIFRELGEAGMTNKDIIHLENLSDPKILELSGIKKEPIKEKVFVRDVKKIVPETYDAIVKKVVVVDEIVKRPSNSKIGRFFGFTYNEIVKVEKEINTTVKQTRMIKKTEKEYEEKITGYKYPKNYHTKKSNLILYLKAWVNILEKGQDVIDKELLENKKSDEMYKLDKQKLEANLKVATANEDYESAARIRDILNEK